MSSDRGPEHDAFERYLSGKKILIADPSAASRSGLFRIFSESGASRTQLLPTTSYKEAQEQIEALKPAVVLAEYDLGKRCGLDLLQSQRQSAPDLSKESLFVVVTGNTSQAAVARAAEEDIDAYIVKPFTVEAVRRTVMKAAMNKVRPPNYILTIEKGKAALAAGRYEEAEEHFIKATTLDPAPALAFYYLGQAKYVRRILNQAKGSYSKGLAFNKIHYKCLVGLYELLANEKDHAEAYEVIKRISQYFPANPKRLADVLRLAIVNERFEDVEKYYSVFCNIPEHDETLIKYICAALVVCGRHYLGTKTKSRALDLFQKVAATGSGRIKILREIVHALLDFHLFREANQFLMRFSPEEQSTEDFLLLSFRLLDGTGESATVLERGKGLIQQGVVDAHTFEIMIKRAVEARLNSAAEAYFQQAIEKFPARRHVFEKLLAPIIQS